MAKSAKATQEIIKLEMQSYANDGFKIIPPDEDNLGYRLVIDTPSPYETVITVRVGYEERVFITLFHGEAFDKLGITDDDLYKKLIRQGIDSGKIQVYLL